MGFFIVHSRGYLPNAHRAVLRFSLKFLSLLVSFFKDSHLFNLSIPKEQCNIIPESKAFLVDIKDIILRD